MPRRKKQAKTTWQDNYAGLILGAIIVVILGLLVANFFSKRNQAIDNGASTSQAQEQQAENPTQYKVQSGDSLSKISEKIYGSEDMWPVLARVNNIANPSLIYADTNLEIPAKEKAVEMKTQMTQTTYQVQAGDTLFTIAEKMYGDGSKWVLLDRANNVGRLPNGNPLIFAGNTLTVPR